MHKATGGRVLKDKVSMCCWKRDNNNIKITNMKIKLNDEILKQLQTCLLIVKENNPEMTTYILFRARMWIM